MAGIDDILEAAQPVVAGLATGAFYGNEAQRRLWIDVFRVIADQPSGLSGAPATPGMALRRLPATVALYAGALSAWASDHTELVVQLLCQPMPAHAAHVLERDNIFTHNSSSGRAPVAGNSVLPLTIDSTRRAR